MSQNSISKRESVHTCSLESLNAEEPLFGTMAKSSVWFLVEYPFSWGAKAFKDSDIPQRVKERLTFFVDSVPEARLQLIKKPNSGFSEQITFYLAIPNENQPILNKFLLTKYEEILDIDFGALLSGEHVYQEHIQREPLYLVCTNGKRDACCAKFGLPVFGSFQHIVRNTVWQTTHVGGHRFAANVLCLPHGILYGRVSVQDVQSLVDSFEQGEILIEKYRGRACYNEVVQAAEYYLRLKTNIKGISAFRLQGIKEEAENEWSVEFLKLEGDTHYRIKVSTSLSNYLIYLSCKDIEKKAITNFRLEQFKTT
jgi:hypothetical protein